MKGKVDHPPPISAMGMNPEPRLTVLGIPRYEKNPRLWKPAAKIQKDFYEFHLGDVSNSKPAPA